MLLNIDLGELPDEPVALYALAQVANIACGGHAGNENSMRAALARCSAHGTAPGAHPSYPDREGFGRRVLSLAPTELEETVAQQCAALAALARAEQLPLRWVKPHGALYHAADADPLLANAVAAGAARALGPDFTLIGPAGGALAQVAAARGLGFASEGFADRRLRRDAAGRLGLVPRSEPGALIEDPRAAAAQARELVQGGGIDTICVHGDGANAVAIAAAVRAMLDALAAPT